MFKVQFYYMEVTPSGGSVTWNTEPMYGECINLYIKPASAGTKYHFKITGPNGFIIYESRTLETGELTLVGLSAVGLVNGIYTCAITNSTADELFKVQMNIKQYAVAR